MGHFALKSVKSFERTLNVMNEIDVLAIEICQMLTCRFNKCSKIFITFWVVLVELCYQSNFNTACFSHQM